MKPRCSGAAPAPQLPLAEAGPAGRLAWQSDGGCVDLRAPRPAPCGRDGASACVWVLPTQQPWCWQLHPHISSISLSPAAPAPLLSLSVAPFPPDAFEHHHVAQLLRRFSSDYATSRNVSLDAALAHHLQQCSYHLRLFRSWLISGQDDLECLYGTARRSCLGPVLL